ncbi:hypothetical protein KK449_06365 [Clostridioides difficile]|nr:hypothetical protein [Clostridioides difficile]
MIIDERVYSRRNFVDGQFSGLMQNMHKAVTFKVVSYKVTWSMKFTRPKYTFGRFYLSKFSLRGESMSIIVQNMVEVQ